MMELGALKFTAQQLGAPIGDSTLATRSAFGGARLVMHAVCTSPVTV
jgi:hypothetical protein